MTVVVADSSPLNYLTLIGSVDVLQRLYVAVVVPQQVISELIDPAGPHKVRDWASNLPDWIDVREAVVSSDDMPHLDPGERAAIVLAQSEPGLLETNFRVSMELVSALLAEDAERRRRNE